MVFVFPKERTGVGEALGQGIERGVSTGLQFLLNAKTQKMKGQQQLALQRAKMEDEFALTVALMEKYGPEQAKQIIAMAEGLNGAPQGEQPPGGVGELLAQPGEGAQPGAPQEPGVQQLLQAEGDVMPGAAPGAPGLMGEQPAPPVAPQVAPPALAQQAPSQSKLNPTQLAILTQRQPHLGGSLAESQKEATRIEEFDKKEAALEGRFQQKQQAQADRQRVDAEQFREVQTEKKIQFGYTATDKFRAKSALKYEEAQKDLLRLRRIRELIDIGEMRDPVLYAAGKAAGLDIQGLMNADTQEMVKLTNDFATGAPAIFGGRITYSLLQLFGKRIPSLMQTDEGKLRVVENLEIFAKMSALKYNVEQDIIRENGGDPPRNLAFLVNERAGPELKELEDQYGRHMDEMDAMGIGEGPVQGKKDVLGLPTQKKKTKQKTAIPHAKKKGDIPSEETALAIWKKVGGDPELAEKEALKLGYATTR